VAQAGTRRDGDKRDDDRQHPRHPTRVQSHRVSAGKVGIRVAGCAVTLVLVALPAAGHGAAGRPGRGVAAAAGINPRGPDALDFVARLHRQAAQEQQQRFRAHAQRIVGGSAAGRRAARYYVDALRGSDSNPGTSPRKPWRTLSRAGRERYIGGDELLLRGGEHFRATLAFSPANLARATARHPLTVSSYGGGRATLAPRGASGLVAINVAGVRVQDLDFGGDRRGCRRATDGIFFDVHGLHRTLSAGISVARVDVSGFCDGIAIGAEDDASRIDHVRITGVRAHDNGDAGVITYDPALKHHDIRDVSITHTVAYRNSDQGGIVLFGVERGSVKHSVVYDNGRGHSGDAGIWAFDADRIVFASDESYANQTNGDDGDGFDLDGGVTNSVLIHDYAHDNQGIGFLICACDGYWYPQSGDVIAHDISVGDGSSGQTSAIYIGGGSPFHGVKVFSNLAYSARGTGPVVSVDGAQAAFANVHFHDNVFIAGGRKVLLDVDTADAAKLTFVRDEWASCARSFEVQWGSRMFSSLAAWQQDTGAEPGGSGRAGGGGCSAARWRVLARASGY
jgi:hypothetical protein